MLSPGFDGGLHSTQELSEGQQQSLARQPTTQHHRGSASDTSNLTSAEVFSGNTSHHQDFSLTAYSRSFTSGPESCNGYASKPYYGQQPDQSPEDFADRCLHVNESYHPNSSARPNSVSDSPTQFSNLTHQGPGAVGWSAYGGGEAMQTSSRSMTSDLEGLDLIEYPQDDALDRMVLSTDTAFHEPVMPAVSEQVYPMGVGLANEPWTTWNQGEHRPLTDIILPQLGGTIPMDPAICGGHHPGEAVCPNNLDPALRSNVSAFNHDVESIPINQQTESDDKNWRSGGSRGTVHQPQFLSHGYPEQPPSGASFDGTNANFMASSSHTRLTPPASTHSPTLDSKQCSICNTPFSGKYWKGNLARHMRLKHRSSRRYKCQSENCDLSFARNDARLKHCRNHHPELGLEQPIRRKESGDNIQNPVVPQHAWHSFDTQSHGTVESHQTSTHYEGSVYQFGEAPFRMPLE